jgi:hypothetical protein
VTDRAEVREAEARIRLEAVSERSIESDVRGPDQGKRKGDRRKRES